ncbi:MAG: lipoyl domain-containing protein [Acidocella sp.]|nr:lipoyl domain-containing protein [Acidocella sp.]
MIYKLSVPAIAEDIEEFRVLEWYGGVGTLFNSGDMIVELETHKAIIEMRAGQTGILRVIAVPDGAWCKIGVPLGLCSDTLDETLLDQAEAASDMLLEFEVA